MRIVKPGSDHEQRLERAHKLSPEQSERREDRSFVRMLGILDLFTVEEPIWSIDNLMSRLGLTKATAYRYVKALQDAGFLVTQGSGMLTLGPRCIELDRQIKLVDPLLRICPSIIADIRDEVNGAAVVCRYYGDRVLAVLQDRYDPEIPLQMERGRPFPLFYGAPSKIIVAYLPTNQQKNLLLHYPNEIASAGLGETWPQFKEKLKAIRKTGYCVSSQLSPLLVGAAAPIFVAPKVITASICLIRCRAKSQPDDIVRLSKMAVEAGHEISARLQQKANDAPDLSEFTLIESALG